jgi:wyosine [tRNA(Phe)-imidazoG37] synthetase (radical SAM superfamily)
MRLIYGPVPSWRLGRSLGVDLIVTKGKTCTLDCVYCTAARGPNVEQCRDATAATGRRPSQDCEEGGELI